jgi:peptidoglycan hydrolase CwlO-like protein
MKKSVVAVLIAFLMTAMVGICIFAVGAAALHNKSGVAVSNSPAQASAASVDQLQSLITQYQDREQQYQQREQQLQNQLSQAQAQIQQDQQMIQQVRMLLSALQQRGLISVTNDGRIFINQ